MSARENITRIKAVYNALEELGKEVIFVGGATVSLYAQRPTDEIRPTDDIDILIELIHYKDYAAVEEKVRSKGFVNDMESGVICRYKIHGIIVDIMPTSKEILGFANKWYPEAAANAVKVTIDEGYDIQIFSAPYFLATKLEAFKDRGKNDGRVSSDFEDIVFVLNNATDLWQQIQHCSGNLQSYLKTEFSNLLEHPYIDEWISAHISFQEQGRIRSIMGAMQEFAGDSGQ